METSGFTYKRECVVRVHGTNARLDEDHGPAWWQARYAEDHRFWKHVILQLPTPIEANEKVFHWNGGNSECDRQVAAAALLEQLLKLEEIGSAYHLVGHSHGGSVLWAALCLACERGNSLNGLLSWTSVGTPFLCFRYAGIPVLRMLANAAFAVVLVVLAVGINVLLGDLKFSFVARLSRDELIAVLTIILVLFLAAFAAHWAWRYYRCRRGTYEREAARMFGQQVVGHQLGPR
jgi:hypothetical protein